jgi:hypothetical protein
VASHEAAHSDLLCSIGGLFASMSRKPRLVLHIGMHKTGTKSLQGFFVANRWILKLFGIDYPKAFDATGRRLWNHSDLFHAISYEKDFSKPHPILGPSAARVADLAQRVKSGRVTVLSAEGLSGESPAFAQAFASLRTQFDCRVVCFLRRQDDWVQSFYKQMVRSRKERESRSFDEFLLLQSTRDHLDYEQMLGWWADSLGSQAIKVEIYSPETHLLRAFLKAAELPNTLILFPFSNLVRNRSPKSGMVERIRAENQTGLPRPLANAADQDVPYFTPKERMDFMRAFQVGNEAIRARFRPDLERLFR